VTRILNVFGISAAEGEEIGYGGTSPSLLDIPKPELLRLFGDFRERIACNPEMAQVYTPPPLLSDRNTTKRQPSNAKLI